ncbi:hypothetical protein [Roseivirga pacifica]|uniref:hypothetical protein n=1 Tax=Roseivirga pacifica TaxID=1267423 RepID=UPI003BAD7087
MSNDFNIEIVGLKQETHFIYTITISTYTNIGFRLDTSEGGYKSLGNITYEGKEYIGMELIIVNDSSVEEPNTNSTGFFVERTEESTIGIYVKCGSQVETIKFTVPWE